MDTASLPRQLAVGEPRLGGEWDPLLRPCAPRINPVLQRLTFIYIYGGENWRSAQRHPEDP